MIPKNGHCAICTLTRAYNSALPLGDADKLEYFMKQVMKMYSDLPEGLDSNHLGPPLTDLFCEVYGLPQDRFAEEKRNSNDYVLQRMDKIRAMAESQPDPLYAGIQLAILGNYLDFSAFHGKVSLEKMDAMLDTFRDISADPDTYRRLQADLEKGKKLLFISDNAGEIGFDRILCEQIERKYPHVEITFCVRGAPASNDALREDALRMGIPYPVIDNGTRFPSTPLDLIGQEARDAIRSADVILSKGMGNLESLYGCGYPVYYMFLIKCPRIQEFFHKPMLTPMFIKDNGGTPYYDKA